MIILSCILTDLSQQKHIFNNRYLSGPYLGKYKRDWN